MTKKDKLDVLMLLSALESWSFADKHYPPDFLIERLNKAIDVLREDVLEESHD